jgi:2-methylcitrate dehydratase PrpD
VAYVKDIAQYIHRLNYDELPEEVLDRVRACWLYNISLALASREPGDTVFAALASIFRASGSSTVLISGDRLSVAHAAAVNAALLSTRGQNDTHPETVTHIGCIVIPAVLAIAEERNVSPRDIIMATLAGYEVVPKIARGGASASIARGFRSTSVHSVFGAAAACARALKLTIEQTANALALASNFSSGLMQCWEEGSDEGRLHVAHACLAGVEAALLAEQGVVGASLALEGPNGFYRAFSGISSPELNLGGWDIMDVTFKPYPGCAFNQASIHALRALLLSSAICPKDVKSVSIAMNPQDALYPGVASQGPFSGKIAALMSGPFVVAATLKDGSPKRTHFLNEYSSGAFLRRCGDVSIVPDAKLAQWNCEVTLSLRDGTVHKTTFDKPRPFVWSFGETEENLKPLSAEWSVPGAADRYAKLSDIMRRFGGTGTVDSVVDLCQAQ